MLEINGNISDKRAERIEDLLWNLIPEAGHLRDQVGRIDVANGARTEPPAGPNPASRRLSRSQSGHGCPRLLIGFGGIQMAEALMQDQAAAEASHKDMANAIRALAMDAVQKAESGHPGMPMGMADVATVLFTRFLKYDASHPEWPDRDRFVLSAGHGSMLIYALLYLTGYPEHGYRGDQEFPAARRAHGRASGIRPRPGHRDDHRTSRPGHRQRGGHGACRAAAQSALRQTTSSITTPIVWRATAASWKASARRPSRLPATTSSAG